MLSVLNGTGIAPNFLFFATSQRKETGKRYSQFCEQAKSNRYITHHEIHSRYATLPPSSIYLAFLIETPYVTYFGRQFISEEVANDLLAVSEPSYCRTENVNKYVRAQCRNLKCAKSQQTYPVANITTSAGNSLPFSKAIPFLENRAILLSFFRPILPSAISLLAPTSIHHIYAHERRNFVRRCNIHSKTERNIPR